MPLNLMDYSTIRKGVNMTKIGIIRCDEKAKTCPGSLCFKSIYDRSAAFEGYDNIEIIGFDTCGGCGMGSTEKLEKKVEGLRTRGAEVVHLSSCMRGKCPVFSKYLEATEKLITTKSGTH